MKKSIIIIVSVALAVIALTAFSLFTKKAPPKVEATFLAYTNLPSGKKMALIRVSNQENVAVQSFGLCMVQNKGSDSREVDKGYHRTVILGSGQSEDMLVDVPSKPGSWKVWVGCTYTGLSYRWSQWVLSLTGTGTGVRGFYVKTGWIDL
jgi:hypothetical protein